MKKTTKPAKGAAKKVVAKKIAAKPVAKKKVVKPVAKNAKTKVVAKKKVAPKKVIAKKPISKKIAKTVKVKAVKKIVTTKVVAKKIPAVKKAIVKKVETKKVAEKVIPKKVEIVKELNKVNSAPIKKEFPATKIEKNHEPVSKKQAKELAATEVLAITNTIPQKEKEEISLSKIASISSSITNPVKRTDSYAIKPEKEPSGKFELEFIVHASADMLYEFLSTPSGLSEWFCDDVNIRNGIYTFIWDGQMQQARLLKTVDVNLVRFQWVDKNDGSYFEFRIQRDDLTNDISLIITDFSDSNSERESSKLLWHSQVEKLMHVIGSIF